MRYRWLLALAVVFALGVGGTMSGKDLSRWTLQYFTAPRTTPENLRAATLSAITADLGTLTAGTIRMGTGTKDSDLDGFQLDEDEIVGQENGADQVSISASDGKLRAGSDTVILDSNGVTINDESTVDSGGSRFTFDSTATSQKASAFIDSLGNGLVIEGEVDDETTGSGVEVQTLSVAPRITIPFGSNVSYSGGVNKVVWLTDDYEVTDTLTGIVPSAVIGVTGPQAGDGAGSRQYVTVYGVMDVTTDDAVSAGDLVKISQTTAGRVEKFSPSGTSGSGSLHTHSNPSTGTTNESLIDVAENAHTHPENGAGGNTDPENETAVFVTAPNHTHPQGDTGSESSHTHDVTDSVSVGVIGTVISGASAGGTATILVHKM